METQPADELLGHLPPHLRPTVERLLSTPEPQRRLVMQRLLRPGAPRSLARVVAQLDQSHVA
ncbi:MAG: hypothetical protein ABR600_01435 [Actinomycetota bacterium]